MRWKKILKRCLILFNAALLLFLAACSDTSDTAKKISENINNLTSANYTADITAIFPSREAAFKLSHSYERDGNSRTTVIAPQEVAGVSMTVSNDTCNLEFDGARLEAGTLSGNGLSPFTALPMLISSWRDGSFSTTQNTHISGKDAILVISDIADEENTYEYRTWFSKETFLPLYAEIFVDGERAIQCRFERTEHKT